MKHTTPVLARIDAIDTTDERYRITRSTDLDLLSRSVDRVGLLNPPILEPGEAGYRIVTGFGRVGACRRLGWKEIEARVLDPAIPAIQCLMIAIADNGFTRPLNVMEQAAAVVKLSAFCPDAHQLSELVAPLGLSANPQLIRKYKTVCCLPEAVQHQIAADTIALPVALEFESLDSASAVGLGRLFDLLRPTLSQQRELLDHMRDIAAIEEKTINDLIEEPGIIEIVRHDRHDRKQKIAMLRDTIRGRRFPALSRAEKNFNLNRQALDLPDGLALLAPKNFESPDYSLVVAFRTASDLQTKAEQVQELSHKAELQSILNRDIENS